MEGMHTINETIREATSVREKRSLASREAYARFARGEIDGDELNKQISAIEKTITE